LDERLGEVEWGSNVGQGTGLERRASDGEDRGVWKDRPGMLKVAVQRGLSWWVLDGTLDFCTATVWGI
jgi:hypothetical protein